MKAAQFIKGLAENQLNELFEPTLNYYTLSNGKMVQASYRPNVNQSPVPFTDVEVSYVNPALKPQGGSFDSTGIAAPWTNAPDGVKQAIQKFVAQPQQGMAEGDKEEKIGGRYDADDFDDMVTRLKKLAGAGPLRTVYDPARRVYKNVPHAVQPAQQPKKAR